MFHKNRGEGFEKSYVSLHGDRGGQNCQNQAYVINEWPQNSVFEATKQITNIVQSPTSLLIKALAYASYPGISTLLLMRCFIYILSLFHNL